MVSVVITFTSVLTANSYPHGTVAVRQINEPLDPGAKTKRINFEKYGHFKPGLRIRIILMWFQIQVYTLMWIPIQLLNLNADVDPNPVSKL